MNIERWLPVVGYEDIYEVSDLGRIRNKNRGRFIAQWQDKKGYRHVQLRDKRWSVHKVVLTAFIGPQPSGMQANHKSTVKSDNSLTNLEWVTPERNIEHGIENGVFLAGESHKLNKLTEEQVIEIKTMIGSVPKKRIARLFNVDEKSVYNIANGVTWSTIRSFPRNGQAGLIPIRQ